MRLNSVFGQLIGKVDKSFFSKYPISEDYLTSVKSPTF